MEETKIKYRFKQATMIEKNRNGENSQCSDKKYEQCICCHKTLNIPLDVEIEFRPFYIEGAGQLCYDCYQELYVRNIKNIRNRS